MRILHLGKYYPPEPGGMEVVVKTFSEATAAFLTNYCVVATRSGKTRVETSGSTTVHYLRQAGAFLLAPVLPGLPRVLHRLRRTVGFRVILLHYPNPTAILALFLSLLVRPKREKIVVWHHADVLLEERWKRGLYALFRPIEEFVFRRADAFVAATPHHVSCSDTFRRFADRTTIIPYALPDGWFAWGKSAPPRSSGNGWGGGSSCSWGDSSRTRGWPPWFAQPTGSLAAWRSSGRGRSRGN
jgi:hypothetical protein